MKLSIVAGATSQSVNVFIQDSSSTTGAGLSGLVFNTSGLTGYYSFAGANAGSVAITLATLAAVNSAWSSGGFKEVDATNMKGVYRLDVPNAALAAAKGRSVVVYLAGAANMAPCVLEIELTGWDNQDAVGGGLSRIDAAVSSRLAPLTAGRTLDVDANHKAPATLAAADVSGNVPADFEALKGTALTEGAAGRLKGAFTTLFDVASPVFTAASANQTGDNYARLGAPAGLSVSADVAAVKADTGGVKAKTDNLPADPAGLAALASAHGAGAWSTAAGFAVAGDAMTLTAGERSAVADVTLRRHMANVEASPNGDALSKSSLYGSVQQIQAGAVAGTTLTVHRTDGVTVLGTFTLTSDPAAEPITGVA